MGELALQHWGSQDIFSTGSPSLSYFRTAMKTHTQFATEPISVEFQRSDMLFNETTTLRCRLQRLGDVVTHLLLSIQLPDICCNTPHRFRWIPYLGECLINNCYLTVAGSKVNQHCRCQGTAKGGTNA